MTGRTYGERLIVEVLKMLRHEPTRDPSISDRELGIAALLLLLAVVLTVAVLPSFI